MEKVKTDLQSRLEQRGWEFLTNESIMWDDAGYRYDSRIGYMHQGSRPRIVPLTDAELHRRYKERSFREVLVTEAFDVHGKPLKDMRAVYVKR